MEKRCPSARFKGRALLRGHKLAFTRKSRTWKCGVADAVREDSQNIWGVVYVISELDLGKLDSAEGYRPSRERNAYWRRECQVLVDGDPQRPLTVNIYFASPEPNPPLPNRQYMQRILSGARYWQLPEEYVAELEAIEVNP